MKLKHKLKPMTEWRRVFAYIPHLASNGPEGAVLGIIPDKPASWVWGEWIEKKARVSGDGPQSWYRLLQS